MKILLLCNKSPYPAFEGGPMAMNSIVTGLLEAGHEVKILAVNSKKYNVSIDDIPEDYRQKTGIETSFPKSRTTSNASSPRTSTTASSKC